MIELYVNQWNTYTSVTLTNFMSIKYFCCECFLAVSQLEYNVLSHF